MLTVKMSVNYFSLSIPLQSRKLTFTESNCSTNYDENSSPVIWTIRLNQSPLSTTTTNLSSPSSSSLSLSLCSSETINIQDKKLINHYNHKLVINP